MSELGSGAWDAPDEADESRSRRVWGRGELGDSYGRESVLSHIPGSDVPTVRLGDVQEPGHIFPDGSTAEDLAPVVVPMIEHETIGEEDYTGGIDEFMHDLLESGFAEIGWWMAEIAAEAHLPSGSALVRGIRSLSNMVETINTLEKADGITVEVPAYFNSVIPVGVSLKATYSDGLGPGSFRFTAAGSVSLDDAPVAFIPNLSPSASEMPDNGRPQDAAVDPSRTSSTESDNQKRAVASSVQRHFDRAFIGVAAITGRIITTKHIGQPSTASDKDECLVSRSTMDPHHTGVRPAVVTAARDPRRALILIVDDVQQSAALLYVDRYGQRHLVALFIHDGFDVVTVYRTWRYPV